MTGIPDATNAVLTRTLWGWIWRFGLIGAVYGSAIFSVAASFPPADTSFSQDALTFSPVLGGLIGAAGGSVGWLTIRLTRRRVESTDQQKDTDSAR